MGRGGPGAPRARVRGSVRAGVRGGGRRTRPLPGVPRWGVHAGRRDGPTGDSGPRSAASPPGTRGRDRRRHGSRRDRRGPTRAAGPPWGWRSTRSVSARERPRPPARPRPNPVGRGRWRGPRRLGGRGDQRVGRRLAVVRPAPRDVVVVHRAHGAHPGSTGRYRLDRRRGCRRRAVHIALPADDAGRSDRHRWRRWPCRVRRRPSATSSPTTLVRRDARQPGCGACSRPSPTSPSRTRGAARSTSAPTTSRGSVPSVAARSTTGTGTAATASARRWSVGRILAAMATERADDPALALPLANGRAPRPFPPEPARYVGARLVREAAARRESMEERGEDPGLLLRELSRLPRRIGYHLGPD